MPSIRQKRFKTNKAFGRKARKDQLATKNYVDRMLNNSKELKWLCTEYASAAVASTWTTLATRINNIDQGDTAADRDGNVIEQLGFRLKFQIGTASDRPQAVRILVLEEKKTYSTSDLPGVTGGRRMIGCVTPDMTANYVVLMDQVYNLEPMVDDGSSLFRHVYKDIYFKRNKRLHYEGNLGSTLASGKVSVYAVSDNLAGGTDDVDIALESLCYFKEV